MKKRMVLTSLLLSVSMSFTPLYARAGGGGSGGGSGGSGGGSSSSSSHTSSTGGTSGGAFMQIGIIGVILVGGGWSAYYYRYRVYKKKTATRQLLKQIDDIDEFWNEKRIYTQVEEIYFCAQSAWTNKNIESLKPYVSEELYERWRMKLDWMDVRNERNVLENVKLLSSAIVGVYDAKIDDNDMLWVCVRGKMVDYKIDEIEQTIIEGDKRSHEFVEYWKFIRKEERILLDEVVQKEDVDINAFINLSEEIHEHGEMELKK